MSNEIRDNRLAFELEEITRLKSESSLIDFQANGQEIPDEYFVTFHCQGLARKGIPTDRHVTHIYLPANYPKIPPVVRFQTPIFHPNIKAMMDDDEEIMRLAHNVGGVHKLAEMYHSDPNVKNLFDARVCLDVLQQNWSPAYTLYHICLELGAMIQYQRYNVDDPLNHEAAAWTRAARADKRLPIDERDLRDLRDLAILEQPEESTIRIITVEKVSP